MCFDSPRYDLWCRGAGAAAVPSCLSPLTPEWCCSNRRSLWGWWPGQALLKPRQLFFSSLSFSAEYVYSFGQKAAANSLCSGVGTHKREESQRLLHQQSPAFHFSLPWSTMLALIHVWQPAQALASHDCYAGFISRFPQRCPPWASSPPLHLLPSDLPEWLVDWERLLGVYEELRSCFSSQVHNGNTNMSESLSKQPGTGGRRRKKTHWVMTEMSGIYY